MKRLLAFVCVFSILFNLTAVQSVALSVEKEYTIETLSTANNITTKRMIWNSRTQTDNRHTETISDETVKEMLLEMGRTIDAINALSQNDLEEYKTASALFSTTSYTEQRPNGVRKLVTKAEALSRSASQNDNPVYDDNEGDNAYLYLYHEALDLNDNDGTFLFTTESTWLSMPAVRGTDTIGSTFQWGNLYGSASGLYWYTEETYSDGELISVRTPAQTASSFSLSQFNTVTDGDFVGGAFSFNLPSDQTGHDYATQVYRKDFFAQCKFRGCIATPYEDTWFNSVGSYLHAYVRFSVGASVLSIITAVASGDYFGAIEYTLGIAYDTEAVTLAVFRSANED